MKTWNLLLMALLLSVTLAYSADSTSPALQVTGYNVVPETVYPGTNGQLELTIENTGTETAKGSAVYYTYGTDQQWSVYLGDIGQNSQAITTIPFVVPDKVSSGILVLNVDLYYLDEDETGSKHTMASIPISIGQHEVLEVRTLSLSSSTIGKGEKLTVALELENTGGVMKNVIISAADNSSFSLAGTTQKRVGDIEANASKNVSIDILSSSSAAEGKYSIPLVLTYQDALQNTITQTVYVGPVTVSDSSSQMRILCTPISNSEIGSTLVYNLTFENLGSSVQSVVIVVEGTDVFTPIGINTFYVDDILPGESRTELITLGIDAGSSSGYYVLPITMQTNGDEQEYDIGIVVQATPEILMTSEIESTTDGTQVSVKISNTGNTAVRSLYIRADSNDYYLVSGSGEKFIGTLSVDDYASYSVTVNPIGQAPAGAAAGIPLTVVFKDNDNVEHTVKKTIVISGATDAAAYGNASFSSSSQNRTFSGRPGGVMGGGSTENIPVYAGIGLVILGGLYLGYRKFRGKKKVPEGSDETRR
jgi:hypothetical protein